MKVNCMLLLSTTELSKENERLKKSSGEGTDGDQTKTAAIDGDNEGKRRSEGLMEELQVVRSERDKAVREEKTLKQSFSLLKQENEVRCGYCYSLSS